MSLKKTIKNGGKMMKKGGKVIKKGGKVLEGTAKVVAAVGTAATIMAHTSANNVGGSN